MLNSLISRANCRANCCWKSKWLCLLKKTLNNAGHIDTKLIDFSKICQKNPAKSAAFYWLFLGKVSPRKFAPENPSKFDFFPAKIPRNWTIFPQICPCKSREILLFFSAKYQKPCFYYSHNVYCYSYNCKAYTHRIYSNESLPWWYVGHLPWKMNWLHFWRSACSTSPLVTDFLGFRGFPSLSYYY